QQLVAQRRRADRAYASFVQAGGAQDQAEARLNEAAQSQQYQAQGGQQGQVQRDAVVGQCAEIAQTLDRQALVTAVLFKRHDQEVEHLRQRQRNHDEGDAAGAQRDQADRNGDQRRDQPNQQQMQ